jgi:hypothetical protein
MNRIRSSGLYDPGILMFLIWLNTMKAMALEMKKTVLSFIRQHWAFCQNMHYNKKICKFIFVNPYRIN